MQLRERGEPHDGEQLDDEGEHQRTQRLGLGTPRVVMT